MKKLLTIIGLAAACSLAGGHAAVLITQYYEGTSFNKWIELTNTGTSAVDLSAGNYNLSLWTNANAEAYKTNGTPNASFSLTGSIAPGASFLYSHASATTPSYAVSFTNLTTNSSVINFNGNDSITLWTGATFATASVVDAIGFTNAGNQGVDKSFVRLTANPGWNTTAGSNVTDFGSVWQQVTLATVDNAAVNTDERLGYSAIPEPSTWALIGLGSAIVLWRMRRKPQV